MRTDLVRRVRLKIWCSWDIYHSFFTLSKDVENPVYKKNIFQLMIQKQFKTNARNSFVLLVENFWIIAIATRI